MPTLLRRSEARNPHGWLSVRSWPVVLQGMDKPHQNKWVLWDPTSDTKRELVILGDSHSRTNAAEGD